MFVSVCKSIFTRMLKYQRQGLAPLRYVVIIILGMGIASSALVLSGHDPFLPSPVLAGDPASLSYIGSAILSVFGNPDYLTNILAAFLSGIMISVMGILMTFAMYLAAAMASYDVVINTPNVIVAWKVMRDVVNLFFVIILLVIAIGTTLKREQYMWNKNLPRFIIAAIFVNFSRTIVAFITDFADVVQQTFVAGFSGLGMAKLTLSLGVTFFGQFTSDTTPAVSTISTLIGVVFVLLMQLVVIAVMAVYFALFTVRIVSLWLIAIFGPVAFVSSILPQTQKYYKDWWSKLSQAAILGPMLAFFMWLGVTLIPDPPSAGALFLGVLGHPPESIGAATQPSFMVGFALMIIVLYFGLQQGMGLAGDFGSFVGKVQGVAFAGATGAGLWGLKQLDRGQMNARQALGRNIQNFAPKDSYLGKFGSVIGQGGTVRSLVAGFNKSRQEKDSRQMEEETGLNQEMWTKVANMPAQLLINASVKDTERGGMTKNAMSSLDEASAHLEKGGEAERAKALEKVEDARAVLKNDQLTPEDRLAITSRIAAFEELDQPQPELDDLEDQKKVAQGEIDAVMNAPMPASAFTKEQKEDEIERRKEETADRRAEIDDIDTAITTRKNDIKSAQKPSFDKFREGNNTLYQRGAALQANASRFAGINMSGITRDAIMQNAAVEKANRERRRKQVMDRTFGEAKNIESVMLEGLDSADPEKFRAAFEAYIEKGKLPEMSNSGNGRKIQEMGITQMYRDEAKAKGMDPAETDALIKAGIERYREQPGSQENIYAATKGLASIMARGDKGVAVDELSRLQELAVDKSGANYGGMTYTELSTGNTKAIDLKVDGTTGQISFDKATLRAIAGGTKNATPENIMKNWSINSVFNNNANGDTIDFSSTFENQLADLVGVDGAAMKRYITPVVKRAILKAAEGPNSKVAALAAKLGGQKEADLKRLVEALRNNMPVAPGTVVDDYE